MNRLFSEVQQRLLKLLASEQAMAILANPKAQAALMRIFLLRAELKKKINGQVKSVAKAYSIATNDEVAKLRRTLRELERHVSKLENDLETLRNESEPSAKE